MCGGYIMIVIIIEEIEQMAQVSQIQANQRLVRGHVLDSVPSDALRSHRN